MYYNKAEKYWTDTLKKNYTSAKNSYVKEFGTSGSPGEDNKDEWSSVQHKAYRDFKSNAINVAIHQFMVHVESSNEHAKSRTANDVEEVCCLQTYIRM